MKIAIFGATGATGKLLTERCLARGVQRYGARARPEHDSICVIACAWFRGVRRMARRFRETVEGVDVVFNALGARSLRKRRGTRALRCR